ncbi:hypothetical protein [Rhodococcoides corynebacterioides]|uniref:hypothetical protein n=1 Tax=Rhodococcoides corynebacterioides TaxID=53972 RepID=UPI0011150186|nr:hypothetical protein [Rhodococcus corynebacterioides]
MTTWAEVEADYHQFFLAAVDADPSATDGAGVIGTSPNVVVVRTGIATGPVSVALSYLEGEPSGHTEQWEDVSRAVVKVTLPLKVMTNFGDVSEDHEVVQPPTTGWLAVQISARGRSERPDAIVEESSEQYLIEVWPVDTPKGTRPEVSGAGGDRGDWYATDATARRRGPVVWNPDT